MKIMHAIVLAVLAAGSLGATGCPAGCQSPNPGQVVIACTMDAVNDPQVVAAVMDALTSASFRDALAALIKPAGKITAEVVACVLKSFTAGQPVKGPAGDKMRAAPGMAELQKERARAYLVEHGVEVQ